MKQRIRYTPFIVVIIAVVILASLSIAQYHGSREGDFLRIDEDMFLISVQE